VKASESEDLLRDFRRLTTSDHFYYMATKSAADGDVHAYFSPYESAYEAYIAFMHVVSDLERRLPGPVRVRGALGKPSRPAARP
jgi:alpha-amylase